MKKIKVDPPIDTILPLKGAHRQVALEWIIHKVDSRRNQDKSKLFDIERLMGNLQRDEYNKVMREVDKVLKQLQRKIDKIKGI